MDNDSYKFQGPQEKDRQMAWKSANENCTGVYNNKI